MAANQLTRAIHAVRAETRQQVEDYNRMRVAFLHEVMRDPRTVRLFELWGATSGLDDAIEVLSTILDRAALRAGVPSRAAFRSDGQALFDAVPMREERVLLLRLLESCDD